MASDPGNSTITFGGYDELAAFGENNENEVRAFRADVGQNLHWRIRSHKFELGMEAAVEAPASNSLTEQKFAQFDPAFPHIYVPQGDFDLFAD
eukprot:CAMPEP_0168622726 /NCGR_PEP_ID=MMETSP0449_2-20121227/8430_1 /TAXON_ID=1082188 /ORGANISM="Strombidium rassoulzadegani, Strain ras09" /LENGTH=92 /DNA_ID=CAMNT_0008664029 /DNA_START=632 /DNA_END=910 /DNA_ORIENTATION=-